MTVKTRSEIILSAIVNSLTYNFGTVLYGNLISVSIQAIKEQKIILDESERRLEVLEERAKEKGLI